MLDERTRKNLKDFPVLDEPQTRIYIMLNSTGKIKIGKSKDIYKRYLSLSGSNSQGNEIIKVLVSPPTYLYTIETIMHEKKKNLLHIEFLIQSGFMMRMIRLAMNCLQLLLKN